MKIALCFIINYEHELNKENIWREWIEYNKDIINIYFFYSDLKKIKSKWILNHAIPFKFVCDKKTSYYHVIPAYISVMRYAYNADRTNQWFCFLTDSCCPIISPLKFRQLFINNYQKSIISYKNAWWNVNFHKRANLYKLPTKYHLANDPWFILHRKKIEYIFKFIKEQRKITEIICNGGLANESLFAIILYYYNQLYNTDIINKSTHIVDWNRRSSPTSPHIFKEANERDLLFIDNSLKNNPYTIFIRKIAKEFPDDIIYKYIEYTQTITNKDKYCFPINNLKEPFIFKLHKVKNYMINLLLKLIVISVNILLLYIVYSSVKMLTFF